MLEQEPKKALGVSGPFLLVICYRSRFGGKDTNHENVSYRVGR